MFAACQATHTEYLRLLREETALPQDALFAADAAQAADLLDAVEGNILLTTGSKDLAEYSRIHGFAQRVFAVSYTHLDVYKRQLLAPTELKIGTVTAVFGAPVVIYMMLKRQKVRQ